MRKDQKNMKRELKKSHKKQKLNKKKLKKQRKNKEKISITENCMKFYKKF